MQGPFQQHSYVVEMVWSHYLKELNTAIQCLGIKPKAINIWLLYQGHWTQWRLKLDHEENDFDFHLCKDAP